jgi:hypothetical protein
VWKARGEGHAARQAPAARAPADRAFGGDVDDFGLEGIKHARAEKRGATASRIEA